MGVHGVIIYSDDNGVSWAQAAVPVNVTLTCVDFATAQTGWAAGHFGVILKTEDAGKSWKMQLDGIQANQLTQQAAQALTVAANASLAAPLAVKRAVRFMEDGPDKPFLTMLVLSPQKVFVFGAYRMVMLTHDGGKDWVDWSLNIYDEFSHNIYGSAVIGGKYYLVMEMGLVFCSNDGGNTFRPVISPSQVTLFGILGALDGSIIVFGVAGAAFRSTDGGQSWTALTLSTKGDITSGRVLPSGAILLVDESGLLFESQDNGASFVLVTGVQPTPFFDIQPAANGQVIAVGVKGVTHISQSRLL